MKSEDIKPHKTNNIHSLKTKQKKSEYSGLFFQTLAHNTCIQPQQQKRELCGLAILSYVSNLASL